MPKHPPLPACAECGMIVKLGEYHPYAACLMFKSCKDEQTVRANLQAITTQWQAIGERTATAKWLSKINNDSHAISFQTMGQYRTAFIREMQSALHPQKSIGLSHREYIPAELLLDPELTEEKINDWRQGVIQKTLNSGTRCADCQFFMKSQNIHGCAIITNNADPLNCPGFDDIQQEQ